MIHKKSPVEKYADLHVHTYFSDGTFSPEEVVNSASSKGLSAIAICDHDCIDGIEPAIKSAKEISLEIIPGIELTAHKNKREIHILGYFIKWKELWLRDLLRKIQDARIERLDSMIEKLAGFDVRVDRQKVLKLSGNGSVGRLHLAKVMFETEAVPSIQNAFDKYIGEFKPCYVEDVGMDLKIAIETIKKAGGISVLAHPNILHDDKLVQEIIDCGVQGIEVFHTDHNAGAARKYERMAIDNNLLITGGSDCHGMGKGRVLMGGVKIPYATLEKLRKAAGQ
ncbi:MAG: PHP domain-containing protein [Candidatus Omnitrophota bacterium]